MQVVIDALNWICGLGPMCMMPIIMFVIGICLRVKIGTLLKCCITTGVGFCGVNLVINTFVAQVGPSVQNMVARFGLHTDIMDVGWPARAAATWAYPLAATLQVDVCSPNVFIQEQSLGIHYNKGFDLLDFVKNKDIFQYKDGYVDVPTKPGLGLEIDEDLVKEVSAEGLHWTNPKWRNYDGTMAEW